jgi:hypothetical protein
MRAFLTALLLTTLCPAQNVHILAQAIAKAEGFGPRSTLPTRLHNPGDLKVVKDYRYPGQVRVGKGGHAQFRTEADGWAALNHQIDKMASGESKHYSVNMTLQEIGKRYAKNSRVWAKNVAHNLGVPPDTSLWEILDVPPALEANNVYYNSNR